MPMLYTFLTCFFLLVVPFPPFLSSQSITFKWIPRITDLSTS